MDTQPQPTDTRPRYTELTQEQREEVDAANRQTMEDYLNKFYDAVPDKPGEWTETEVRARIAAYYGKEEIAPNLYIIQSEEAREAYDKGVAAGSKVIIEELGLTACGYYFWHRIPSYLLFLLKVDRKIRDLLIRLKYELRR